jgi:hypothetical protein
VKRFGVGVVLVLVVPLLLACGGLSLSNLVGGGDSYTAASDLWSDVPRMDGLTPSQAEELPLPIKLVLRTVIGNLGKLNGPGEDQTTGNVDWISLNTSATPDDVMNFYTSERMASAGWDQNSDSSCISGSEQGAPQIGAVCLFAKTENGTGTYLAILATQDDTTKQTSVFFLRLAGLATPQP